MMGANLKFWRKHALAMICVLLVFLSLGFTPLLLGQSATTGAITGTVTDSSNAVVPNATVTVTNIATGQARTTTTSASGTYTVGFLPPGNYSVKFEATGFNTASVASITLNVTERPAIDQVLTVGSQTQQVEVAAEAELVQTASSAVGTVVDSATVTELPLTTRNYTNLVGLTAGVAVGVFNAVTMGRGSQDIYVNGAGYAENNYQQDGAIINSLGGTGSVADQGSNPGTAIVNPDAIAEFKIQTSLFDAAYGRNPGANVNVVTKSGTNQFHGTLFEFFRNTIFNSNDFFRSQNAPPLPNGRPVLDQNQFGGTIGGPIKKDKLFFFASEQETRQINGAAAYGFSTPTLPPIPSGDRSTAAFKSALGAAFCGTLPGTAGSVPVSCTGSNINPVALAILNLKLPDGTYYLPGSGTSGNLTVSDSLPVHFTEHQILGNVDYVINSKNTLSLRYFYSRDPASITIGCAGSGGAATSTGTITPCLPGAPGTTNFPASYTTLKLTSLVTNNFVNEARLSVQTVKILPTQGIPFTDQQVGITPIVPSINALAQITFTTPKIQFGAGSNLAKINTDSSWEAADSISWSHGKHTVRAGFEFERDRLDMHSPGSSLGSLAFTNFSDFLIGLPACTGTLSVAAGTCNGSPTLSNISNTGLGTTYAGPGAGGLTHLYRDSVLDAFAQDDFKIFRNLTLNLGLRWEYDGWPTDIQGFNTNLWIPEAGNVNVPVAQGGTLGNSVTCPNPSLPITCVPGSLAGWVVPANYNAAQFPALPAGVTGITTNTNNSIVQNGAPKDAFAPRVGFAWKPTSSDKLAVRGGFGVFYDRLSYAFFGRNSNPPFATVVGGSGSGIGYASESQPFLQNPQLGWTNAVRWAIVNTNPLGSPALYPGGPTGQNGVTSNITTAGPIGPVMPLPTTYQYNLTVQYEFAPSWVLQLGYVGSHAIHIFPQSGYTELERNQSILASPSNPVNGITVNTDANANVRVPYLGFSTAGLFGDFNSQFSKYNSVQATLQKQLSHGLTFQATYSYSRSFSSATYVNYNDATITPYGLNPLYRPQRLTLNYHYELPFGKHEGLVSKLVDGWSVEGVTIVQDGQPLTPIDTRGAAIYGFGTPSPGEMSTAEYAAGMGAANVGSTAGGNDQNRLGCANTLTTCPGGGWFNRAAFGTVPIVGATPGVAGTGGTGWGNGGLGTILGPGQFNFDTTIQKRTVVGGLREDATLIFRTDFFNTFNHPQFANPTSVDVSTTNFGQISSTSVNPRLMQFSLKYVF
jgi:hypothetical protein